MTRAEKKASDEAIPIGDGTVLPPGDGRTISMMGGTITFKTDNEETGGAWSLLELSVPPRFAGPPPHRHKETQEAFYVLEGTLTIQVGERAVRAVPGSYVFVPTGVTHAYANPEDEPARFLGFVSPGGFEGYFDELAALMGSERKWPPADMGKLTALMARYDTFPVGKAQDH